MPYKRVPKPPVYKGKYSSLPEGHFGRLDMRVGVINELMRHPKQSFRYYITAANVGDPFSVLFGMGLVKNFPESELLDKLVVVCCNLQHPYLKNLDGHYTVMVVQTNDSPQRIALLKPPPDAEPGDIITVKGYAREPDTPFLNPEKNIFETVQTYFGVDGDIVTYKKVPWQIEGKEGYITTGGLWGSIIPV